MLANKNHKSIFCVILIILLRINSAHSQVLQDTRVVVKLKTSIDDNSRELSLSKVIAKNSDSNQSTPLTLDSLYDNVVLERVFPFAGKYEERHKEFGLDQWYYVKDKNNTDQEAIKDALKASKRFELVEIEQPYKKHIADVSDSLFSEQWYFNNTGQTGGRVGADIALINALKLEKGSKEIIISIHDSGIDYGHPDVIKNLWVNEGEIPDNGIDDDNNGYIDDIHGFNFVFHTNDLVDRHGHGTAIASIIAAKSDPSGLLGVAGGDSEETGVRLMICRLDNDYPDLNIINPQESFVYAADNGSIISSNSWGSHGRNQTILTAMEYYAAVTGNEYMDTGLLVFSAGNNSSNRERSEKENPNVMSIASTDHNDKLSSFSNFGLWIDICAPGENIYTHAIDGKFDYVSGTSFASPMVAGIAGLVLSKYGHPGYTLDSLRNRLLASGDNIDEFNSGRHGMLGAGRINAFKALLKDENDAPDRPENLWISESAYFARLGMIAPFDNTIAPFGYEVELRSEGLDTRTITFYEDFPNHGDSLSFKLDSLQPEATYSFNVRSIDYFNNLSGWSDTITFTTAGRPALSISQFKPTISFKRGEASPVSFSIENNGASAVSWRLKDTIRLNKFDGITFKISSENHDDIVEVITQNGGHVSVLNKDFLESDLLGVHVLVIDDNIQGFDSDQITYIRTWIQLGGKIILGLDSEQAIIKVNELLEGSGITYHLYEEIYYTYYYNLTSTHFLLKNVRDMYLYFYKAFLTLDDRSKSVLLDENGQSYMALSPFGNGEIIAVANQYFQDFNYYNLHNETVVENSLDHITQNVVFTSDNQLSGVLQANETTNLLLNFNQNLGPLYKGNLVIATDDYETPVVSTQYTLEIVGEPRSVLMSDSLKFDTTFVGYPDSQSFYVVNGGTDRLDVTFEAKQSVFAFSENFTATLNPGDSIHNIVTFTPDTTRFYSDNLHINCSDSQKTLTTFGEALVPPKLIASLDTVKVSSLNDNLVNKRVVVSNKENTSELRYHWKVYQSERSYDWTSYDSSEFSGQIIGVSNLNTFGANLTKYPFYDRNNFIEVKTPFHNNPFDLDTLDLLVMDDRFWKLTKSEARLINDWIKNGGKLLLQADQNYDQVKFDLLFENTAIKGLQRTILGKYDTLSNIFYHPITEGVSEIWSGSSRAFVRTDKPQNVLIADEEGEAFMVWDTYGAGKIIVFSHRVFINNPSDSMQIRLMDQTLAWLFDEANDFWFSVKHPHNNVLTHGESELFDLTIKPVIGAKKEAILLFETNEPDSTRAIVVYMDARSFSNTPPRLISESSTFQINENPEIHSSIGRIITEEDEDGDWITFIADSTSYAYVSPLGELTVRDSIYFDYENTQELLLNVRFTDHQDTTVSPVSIIIQNVNEAPYINDTTFTVAENIAIGEVVGTVVAGDPENDLLVFSMEMNDFFKISDSGVIVISYPLIHNEAPAFVSEISVSDGEFDVSSSVTINIDKVLTVQSSMYPGFYPNPGKHFIYVLSDFEQGLVFDQSGTEVLSFSQPHVNIDSLSPGVYVIILFDTEGASSSYRLIKRF